MTNDVRFGVFLSEGVQTVEALEAVLPPPWKFLHKVERDGKKSAVVVAHVRDGANEEQLRQELIERLADRDMEWWEETDEAATREAEQAATSRIREGLRKKNGEEQ